jgi:hypothetical protein
MTYYTRNLRVVPNNTCQVLNTSKHSILIHIEWDINPLSSIPCLSGESSLVTVYGQKIECVKQISLPSAQSYYSTVPSGKQSKFKNTLKNLDFVLRVHAQKIDVLDTPVRRNLRQRCIKVNFRLVQSSPQYTDSRGLQKTVKGKRTGLKQIELLIKVRRKKKSTNLQHHFNVYPYRSIA